MAHKMTSKYETILLGSFYHFNTSICINVFQFFVIRLLLESLFLKLRKIPVKKSFFTRSQPFEHTNTDLIRTTVLLVLLSRPVG
jgi:hypothetical protein